MEGAGREGSRGLGGPAGTAGTTPTTLGRDRGAPERSLSGLPEPLAEPGVRLLQTEFRGAPAPARPE